MAGVGLSSTSVVEGCIRELKFLNFFCGSILDQLTLTFIRNLVDSVFNFNLDHFISPPVSLDCIEFCIM